MKALDMNSNCAFAKGEDAGHRHDEAEGHSSEGELRQIGVGAAPHLEQVIEIPRKVRRSLSSRLGERLR
jgi:hypothetical protein